MIKLSYGAAMYKGIAVVNSCKTIKQLIIAKNYIKLLLLKTEIFNDSFAEIFYFEKLIKDKAKNIQG